MEKALNCGRVVLFFCLVSFMTLALGTLGIDSSFGLMVFGSLGAMLMYFLSEN